MEAHTTGIHHLHLPHPLLEHGGRRAIALEREFHVVARDGIAIVEAGAPAEDELPHAPDMVHDSARLGALRLAGIGFTRASWRA